MKKHKISLSTKTFSFFILFSAITILIVSLVQSSLLPFIYEKTKKNNLNDSLTSVITNFYLSDADLQNTCDDIALYYGTSILITDEEFNPIVSSRGITSEDLTKYSRDVLAMLTSRAISNGGSYQEKVHIFLPNKPDNAFIEEKSSPFIPNDDLESLIQVAITSSDTGLNRIIFISAVLSASNEMVKTNQILLLLIFIIMILLSLILAFIFSHSLSRPIVEMNDEAQKLMEGNFDVAFEENTGTKEIDELGTKLNQAAKELGKVDRLRSELVANISHDLRTPLTLITGYSEMMRDLPGEENE
ncbi:MAG: HAMP domain-containing protein [Oscillospiraceae bacterium]|nr:HAMP domain-containing protein [Oscillospiraceae bacterium]